MSYFAHPAARDSKIRRCPSSMDDLVRMASTRASMSPLPRCPVSHSSRWKSPNSYQSCFPLDLAASNWRRRSAGVALSNARFSMGKEHVKGPTWSAIRKGSRNQSVSTWLTSVRSTMAGLSISGCVGLITRTVPLGWSGSNDSQPSLYSRTHWSLHWNACRIGGHCWQRG